MKLSTGKIAFPVEFDNGDKGVIYFNPHDRQLKERLQGFEKNVEQKVKDIDIKKYQGKIDTSININIDDPEKLLDLNAEELQELQNRIDAIDDITYEYNKAISNGLDEAFASKISDVVFRYCQPLDIVTYEDDSGETQSEIYVMCFLRILLKEISKYSTTQQNAANKHLSKYA